MSVINPRSTEVGNGPHGSSTKAVIVEEAQRHLTPDNDQYEDTRDLPVEEMRALERRLVRKIDWRLCTIAGILCSLNLLDSGIISSASVTSIFKDLDLGIGNRYVS